MEIEPEVKYAINDVLSCDSFINASFQFTKNYELLKECRFIFFTENEGANIPYFLQNQKIQNFSIHSLASTTKMFVLDKLTYKEMLLKGKSTYSIDACLALDTQTVSYLRNIFTKNPTQIPQKMKPCIEYLIKNNINYDYALYIIENSIKLNNQDQKIVTYENILSCERFKCMNTEKYLSSGKISYTKTDNELLMDSDEVFSNMNNISEFTYSYELFKRYYAIKALLLKVAYIDLEYSKKGIKFKILMLLDFVNKEIGCILEREIAISYLFLLHDNKVARFFKKIKTTSVDIIKHIDGMSWDLAHLRYLEFLMANMQPLNSRYELYSIITFDYGLQDVIKAYPIKKCALYKGVFLPVFEVPLYNLIKEIDNMQEFLEQSKVKRYNTFRNVNYLKLIEKLEKELSLLIKV